MSPTTDDSAPLIPPRSIAMEYRKLWLIGVAFALLAGFSMVLAIWQSHHLYKIVSER